MKSRKEIGFCSRWTLTLVFVVLALSTSSSNASVKQKDLKPPQEGYTQIITLHDGSKLFGKITEVREGEITFESTLGSTNIAIDRIAALEEVPESRFRGGSYWFTNPNQTRMFIGSTARMLEQGQGYFLDIYVFLPSIAYGLTKNVSISAGGSLFPGVDAEDQIYWGTLKVGLGAADKLDFAASGLIIRIPDWDDDDLLDEPSAVGTIGGIATYGSEDNSITVALGYGWADDELADKPLVTVGGEYRLARRLSFVSENWIIPDVEDPLISYGVRFFGEDIAVDLAFMNVLSEDAIVPGIPYLDFVWNF
jgi:hypothetical protein